ncbi:MAG: calcium-binding protein [Gammaproteobacteria bacterium]|nr:calcium-binding protein [Gammaproteobacteria bacterium]
MKLSYKLIITTALLTTHGVSYAHKDVLVSSADWAKYALDLEYVHSTIVDNPSWTRDIFDYRYGLYSTVDDPGSWDNNRNRLYDFSKESKNYKVSAHGNTIDDVLYGSSGHDLYIMFGGNDQVSGGEGDDGINGYYGNDFVMGGPGDDYVVGGSSYTTSKWRRSNSGLSYGAYEADIVIGGTGRDYIKGGYGDDILYGGDIEVMEGSEVLEVYNDKNELVTIRRLVINPNAIALGDNQTDVFKFYAGDGTDTIKDFELDLDYILIHDSRKKLPNGVADLVFGEENGNATISYTGGSSTDKIILENVSKNELESTENENIIVINPNRGKH